MKAFDLATIQEVFADLVDQPRWVCWRYEERRGKRTKVPLQPNGRNALTDKPRTWTTLARCVAYAEATPGVGVGIVFTGDGLVGVDLDSCIDAATGEITAEAAAIVADHASYTEKTPSGTGLHIICRGELPGGATGTKRGNIEVYATGRFFTVTGAHLPGTPDEITEAAEPLAQLWTRIDAHDPSAGTPGENASEVYQAAPGPDTPWRRLNTAALGRLAAWVPELFGDAAKFGKGKGGYRISAADLERDLQEDLSIMPHGIRDFGMGDLGPDGRDNGRQGKRTPIDLVLEFGGAPDELHAMAWLAERLGKQPEDFGFEGKPKQRRSATKKQPQDKLPTRHEDGRTLVYLDEEHVNRNARKCARLLDEHIFLRGSLPAALVRVEEVADKEGNTEESVVIAGVRHERGSLIFSEPTPERVGYLLDERALFQRFDLRQQEWVPKACPVPFARRIVGVAPELRFRPCAGIVAVPLFRDGEVIATNGYDHRTGSIIQVDGDLPAIPERPTKEDAERAMETLLGPFKGYLGGRNAEETKRLRAGFAAAAQTAVLRPSLPAAPAVLVEANVPGAGKGKAARALAVIATGGAPAVITEGHSEEETEKRLAAAILGGSPALLLDNLQRTLESSTLESGLTEGVATIRPFGRLVDITVPCSALTLITANNASLRADMLRRTLPVRIVVDTDTPELRRYDFDPYQEARRNRLEIVAAGLTIARAWHQARGSDEAQRIRKTTLGSFEDWASLVAGAVEWLVGFNPITLIEERKAEDPMRGAERRVIAELVEKFGDQEWTAKEAVGDRAKLDGFGGVIQPATGLDPDVWGLVIPYKGERPTALQVGYWLRKRKDKVFGDWKLVGGLDRKGIARWKVLRLPGMPGIAGDTSSYSGKFGSPPSHEPRAHDACHDDKFTNGGGNIPGNPRHPRRPEGAGEPAAVAPSNPRQPAPEVGDNGSSPPCLPEWTNTSAWLDRFRPLVTLPEMQAEVLNWGKKAGGKALDGQQPGLLLPKHLPEGQALEAFWGMARNTRVEVRRK